MRKNLLTSLLKWAQLTFFKGKLIIETLLFFCRDSSFLKIFVIFFIPNKTRTDISISVPTFFLTINQYPNRITNPDITLLLYSECNLCLAWMIKNYNRFSKQNNYQLCKYKSLNEKMDLLIFSIDFSLTSEKLFLFCGKVDSLNYVMNLFCKRSSIFTHSLFIFILPQVYVNEATDIEDYGPHLIK